MFNKNDGKKMKRALIVGFGHRARSGKDTCADYLVNNYGFTRVSFADALYEECRNLQLSWDGVSDKMYYTVASNENSTSKDVHTIDTRFLVNWMEKNVEPDDAGFYNYTGMTEKDAPLLQLWGTEIRRKQDKEYWIGRMKNTMKKLQKEGVNKIVASDVRFKNEALFIQGMSNGFVIKTERVNPDGTAFFDPSRDKNHASEKDLSNWKWFKVLSAQSGDLDGLYKQVDALVRNLGV